MDDTATREIVEQAQAQSRQGKISLITEDCEEDFFAEGTQKLKDKILSELTCVPVEAPQKLYVTKSTFCTFEKFVGIVALLRNGRERLYTPKGEWYPYGGDMKLYWCPKCHYPLDPNWRTQGTAICQRCNSSFELRDLIGEYCFSCSWQHFLDRFMEIYRRVLFCDVYVARNVRAVTGGSHFSGRDLLDIGKNVHEGPRVVYPFTHIMADIKHHADMRTRFSDFLRSA